MAKAAKSKKLEPAVVRNVLIDRIGIAGELIKQYAEPLREQVKGWMIAKGIKHAQGNLFDGATADSEPRFIPAAELWALVKKGKITLQQFLSAIGVKIEACEVFLSADEIDRIAEKKPKTTSLKVTRKPGVDDRLVARVKAIAKAIG